MHHLYRTSRALLVLSFLTGLLHGCATPAQKAAVPTAARPSEQLLVILGTNDIHGALAPVSSKSKEAEGVAPIEYERGGLSVLAGHLKVLRSKFGQNLLWLDAGDEFQGSVESNLEEGAPMVRFFNETGLNAATIGNHEFDFGPVGPEGTETPESDRRGALKARISEAKYPYLASNIEPPIPGTIPSRIFMAGALKVGVLGLSTTDTPTTTRAVNVKDLKFEDLAKATVREAEKLRAEGAQVVIALGHIGIRCDMGRTDSLHRTRRYSDSQTSCDPNSEVVQLLRSIPPGTLDAVVSGHSHTIVHHYILGVPVIQAGARGHHYNLAFLAYDWDTKKLVPEDTRIEGPIPVCPRVFKNQQDCNGERPAPRAGRGALVEPTLYGERIIPDSRIEALLAPTFQKTAEEKKRVVGQAARRLDHSRTRESELGNLIADAIRENVHADVALMNAGGIRAPIEAGPITFEDAFRTFPFDNSVSLLTVTGAELKMILRVAENGSRGFFPVSGLKLRLIDQSQDAPTSDLNGDKVIQPWEANRLLEAKLADGSRIEDGKKYKLATIDFLVTGGDDLSWAMSRIPADRIQLTAGPLIRDVFLAYMKEKGALNSAEHPLVDPANPRFVFEQPGKNRKGKGRSRHRRHRR